MGNAGKTALLGAPLIALLAWALVTRDPRAGALAARPSEREASTAPVSGTTARDSAELDAPTAPRRTPSAPPLVPEAPPPADLVPPVEATPDEASPPLIASLAPGALEVLVLSNERPLPGARVVLHGRRPGGPPQELERLLEHGLEGVTGADGVTAFGGLEPDTYTLRVLSPRLPVLEITAVAPPGRGARALAVYGAAAVEGVVYDAAGAPLADCWILGRSQGAPSGGQWSRLWVATDPDGAYRVDGLPAGVAWITRTCGGEESVSIALEPGALARVDFGWPGGAPIWRGTVRGSDGAALDVPGYLTTLRLENGERGHFAYEADGSFEARLRPGRYSISALGYEGSFVAGEVEIPPQGLARDVTLPLARVVVELDYAGALPDAQGVLDGTVVRMRRGPEGLGRVAENVGGRRLFRGVPPGVYYLAAGSRPIVSQGALDGSGTLPLTVPPEAAVVRARIAIGDP